MGKRIYCSNRCQRGAVVVPGACTWRTSFRSGLTTTQVFGFVLKWVSGDTLENAYLASTGALDARNAHRWVRKLALRQGITEELSRFVGSPDPAPSPGRCSHAALVSVLARLIRVFHDGNAWCLLAAYPTIGLHITLILSGK